MGHIRDDEVRRLLAYLRRHIQEEGWLAEIEDVLRSDEADEYLREEHLLEFFPLIEEKLLIQNGRWAFRIIPHAHLRLIQRGISPTIAADMFRQFIDYAHSENQIISTGRKIIINSRSRRGAAITLRVDIDEVEDAGGRAHVVTVIIGRASADEDADIVIL
jgi:hypothetical protein